MTTLHFVTLNTGTIIEYDRNVIDDEVIQHTMERLHCDGQLVQGWSIVTQTRTNDEAQFEVLLDQTPMTRCWLCLSPTNSKRLWQDAITLGRPLHPSLKRPTTFPWLAVTVTPTIADIVMTRPERLLELPMIEVVVAWALAEPRH